MLSDKTLPGIFADSAGSEESDEAIAASGTMDGFVALYRRHLGGVYRYLYGRLGSAQEAEDVTGLTFERAWFSLPGYRPEGSFKGWLFTIAARALADHLTAKPKGQVQVESLSESLPDPAPGPEEAALRSERVNDVLQVMGLLAPEQREIIALRFLGELRYAEIAEITGKSEAAVKMAAYRALEEMRRRCGNAPND